jgi:Ca2+-binding RTX toxin-like protein
LTYGIKTGAAPSKGSIAIAIDGTFAYTPNPDANGQETFTLVVMDALGASAEHTFAFEISPVNDAPVARDDSGFTVKAATTVILSAADLLANDTDADGDALTIASVGNATGGSVELLTDGNVRFTAQAGFSGPAGFDYVSGDGTAASQPAKVHIDVSAPPPVKGVTLTGTNCADRLVGTGFDDTINGRKGDDVLIGQGGNDVFRINGDDGTDRFDGGPGYDIIRGSGANDVVHVLSRLTNLKSIEEIDGGGGNNDRIVATSGNDVLDFSKIKLTGIEQIALGAGNDWVRGSDSGDHFAGGTGQDVFVFGPGSGHDVIADFKANGTGNGKNGWSSLGCAQNGDIIDLQLYDFDNYSDVRHAMHQCGRNVVINLEAGSSITLEQMKIAELSAWDFRV